MRRFQDILVVVDTHFDEHPALQWGAQIAQFNKARLKIIEVVPELSWIARHVEPDHEELMEALEHEKLAKLESIAAPLRTQGLDVSVRVRHGKVVDQVIDEVTGSDHDLVVRVTKGVRSRRTGLFGTSSLRLLRHCPCAVWFVRVESAPRFDQVLAAIDPVPDDGARQKMNRSITDLARSVAGYRDGELQICHGWSLHAQTHLKSRLKEGEFDRIEQQAESTVAEAVDDFLSAYDLSHASDNVHLLRSELGPGDAISAFTKQKRPDVIVMGTVGRSGVAGAVLGNTAEFVLDHVECSVLAIKPETFIAPASGS